MILFLSVIDNINFKMLFIEFMMFGVIFKWFILYDM